MEAKGWMIVETGSAAGLDGSIAKAAERGENWFGYYWSPTALIGKYNMQAVDMGEFAEKITGTTVYLNLSKSVLTLKNHHGLNLKFIVLQLTTSKKQLVKMV